MLEFGVGPHPGASVLEYPNLFMRCYASGGKAQVGKQTAKVPGKSKCKSLPLAMFFRYLCCVALSKFAATLHTDVCSCLAQEQIIASTMGVLALLTQGRSIDEARQ